jgi:predicted DNA-binding transcriptional regulator AlpA
MKGTKVFITMPEMMEQMDVSDKTIHRMIEDGNLPDFSYGSKNSKKKGWHSAIIERHAMDKYEQSQSIQNARHIGQVGTQDMGVTLFRGRDGRMSKNLTDLKNGSTPQKKLRSKKVS